MAGPKKYKLRSLTEQLNHLAAESVGRGEEWLRNRFEGFHWSIEDRYVKIHQENDRLREENEKLKEEYGTLHQQHIDMLLGGKRDDTDFGLSHRDRVKLAQDNIDHIMSQNSGHELAPEAIAAQDKIDQIIAQSDGSVQPVHSSIERYSLPVEGTESHVRPELFPTPRAIPLLSSPPCEEAPQNIGQEIARDQYSPPGLDRLSEGQRRGKHESPERARKRPRLSRIANRPLPVCRLCFASKKACDGGRECEQCIKKGAVCRYQDCSHGDDCTISNCQRLHPEHKAATWGLSSAEMQDMGY